MSSGATYWSGWGRWLSFVAGTLLIVLSLPLILTNSAAAGWNIFLGLLLLGAVASGNERAPLIAIILSAIMVLRIIVAWVSGAGPLDLGIAVMFLVLIGGAAYHLRLQARSA